MNSLGSKKRCLKKKVQRMADRIVAAVSTNSADLMPAQIAGVYLLPYRPLFLQGPCMSSVMNSALFGTKMLKVVDPTF